jgi:hypothetical protein
MPLSRLIVVLALWAGWGAFVAGVQAQSAPASSHGTAHPAAVKTEPAKTAKPASKPLWSELTPEQQQALEPLKQLWPTMREPHKRKWLALSRNFASHSKEEKSVLQGRMHEWAALTPQQRTFARLNYADVQRLSTDEKRAKWEAYQALSQEDKQKLAKQQPKPLVGAAPAIKPTPAQNRVTPPTAVSNSKPLPRINTAQVAPATLLPAPAGAAAAGSATTTDSNGPTQ